MLAVAVVGMLVYSAAGAAPGDGKELGPGKSSTTTTSKCEPTKPGGGKGGDKDTTSTTRKDDDKETTSTTRKDDDKETTSTTRKDDDKDTTSTTRKDDDKDTTSTTRKDGDKGDGDPPAAKAAAPSGAVDLQGAAVPAAKDADSDDKATNADADKDCGSTTTTRKGGGDGKDDGDGKGSTTSTTRKKSPTTTTTDKDDKDDDKGSTTSTTRQRGVQPHTPNPHDPGTGGSPDPGGSADPGDTPVEPQEAPPFDAPDSDPGPAGESEAAADPGPVDDSGSFDMWEDEDDYFAVDPMEAPGSGSPLPVFNQLVSSSGGIAADVNRRERSRSTGSRSRGSGRGTEDIDELAFSPEAVTSRSLSPAAVTESEAVRRRLGGTRASAVTESAFPGNVISTPGDLPLSRRNPLAAAALVLLAGVSRELFKVWRRRASDFWPA